jgi:uncharacterized protein (TIGR03118 family)
LVNAWGIAYFQGGPFWLSDNGSGKSTLYNGTGQPFPPKNPLVVTVPPAAGTGHGLPTGIVANSTTDFVITGGAAAFIFATSDGTISGWNGGPDAVIAVNRSGSRYTGLAMGFKDGKNFLYAADNGPNARVDMFGPTFNFVTSFTDTSAVSVGLHPYNVQNINGYLYVTFGSLGTPGGMVDIFDAHGNFVTHFTKSGTLDAPWGLALAPPNFGKFSNALLVGNVGNGYIIAFDYTSHAFLGRLADTHLCTIKIDGLWGLTFGGSGGADVNGEPNQLFFSAGPNDYADGLFGVITLP